MAVQLDPGQGSTQTTTDIASASESAKSTETTESTESTSETTSDSQETAEAADAPESGDASSSEEDNEDAECWQASEHARAERRREEERLRRHFQLEADRLMNAQGRSLTAGVVQEPPPDEVHVMQHGICTPADEPPAASDPPRPVLADLDIDPEEEPEAYARLQQTVSYLGGEFDGQTVLSPEEIYGIETSEVAATLAGGNPVLESALSNAYGGQDFVAGVERAPVWEDMGLSRDQFAAQLVTEPWTVASHHLGHDLSEAAYRSLQETPGPLGNLLDLGVHPETALTIQESWSARFYGGHDPLTGSDVDPVWDRWSLGDPQTLVDTFAPVPEEAAALTTLVGGENPLDGSVTEPPWGIENPSVWAGQQTADARRTLGLPPRTESEDIGLSHADVHVLALTTPRAVEPDFLNPIGLAQSPAFRNGLILQEVNDAHGGLVSALHDPANNGVGLFGLVKVDAGDFTRTEVANSWFRFQHPGAVQAHGLVMVHPEEAGLAPVYLLKVQHVPYGPGGPNQGGEGPLLPSHFFKVQGRGGENPGFIAIVGQGDEYSGSRGRRAVFVGADWSRDESGDLDSLGFVGAVPTGGRLHHGALGPQLGFARNDDGDWVLNEVGVLFEASRQRYQVLPVLRFDENSGNLEGVSVVAGTGYALGEFGYVHDQNNPTFFVDPHGQANDVVSQTLGGTVRYSDPTHTTISFAGLSGNKGKTFGLGVTITEFDNTEVYLSIPPGADPETYLAEIQSLHAGFERGALTLTDLAAGTGVSTTFETSDSVFAMGFYGLWNASAGGGTSERVVLTATRPDEETLTVTRSTQPAQSYFGAAGLFGVGPGFSAETSLLEGETFTFHGDPSAEAERALDEWSAYGLLPGASEAAPEAYAAFEEAQRKIQLLSEARTRSQIAARDRYRREMTAAVEEMNATFRATHRPGDEVLSGVTLNRVATHDANALALTFVAEIESTTTGRGQIDVADGSTLTSTLERGYFGRPALNAVAASSYPYDPVGEGFHVLRSQSPQSFFPRVLLDDIHHDVPPFVLQIVENNPSYYGLGGSLQVALTDDQLVTMGEYLATGPESAARWAGMSGRIDAVFSGAYFAHQPPSDAMPGGIDLLNGTLFYDLLASDLIVQHDLDVSSIARLGEVSSLEDFQNLSAAEQAAYTEAAIRSSHDWPDGNGNAAPAEDVLALIPAQLDAEARSQLFRQMFEDQRHSFLNPARRDPTTSLIRYASENLPPDGHADVMSQTQFSWSPPEALTRFQGKPISELETIAERAYDLQGGFPRIGITWEANQIDAPRLTGALAEVYNQRGAAGVWNFIDDQGINVNLVFERFDETQPEDVIMSGLLAEILLPGAATTVTGQPYLEAIVGRLPTRFTD